jgi:hypothetical protein
VDGVKVPPEEMVKPENIRRVAEKVRTFHRHAPPLAGEFNVFRRVEMLTATSRRNHCKFPANFYWIVQRMREVEDALGAIRMCPGRAMTTCSTSIFSTSTATCGSSTGNTPAWATFFST